MIRSRRRDGGVVVKTHLNYYLLLESNDVKKKKK